MPYLGNRRTTADSLYGGTNGSTDNQRATIFGPMPENGWVTSLGVWGGRNGTAPTVSLALWNATSGNVVGSRRAYTDTFAPSATMTNAAGGASYESNITHTNSAYSPLNTAAKVDVGEYYALGFLATAQNFNHGMSSTAKSMHRQTVGAQPPSQPFVASSSAMGTTMSVWATYTANTAPSTPTGLAPTGSISTATPTFTATYTDAQRSLGDMMSEYKFQLRVVGTTSLLWNQAYAASTSEQAANAVSRVYGGTALTAGVAYEWRVLVYDQHGEASSYTAWQTFTITSGLGVVNVTGATPNGKQNAVNGFTFQGYWTHSSALSMTHVRCALYQNGTYSQAKEYDIPNVASSGGLGTFFSATFANFGFEDLAYGQSYSWRMRGKDTSGVYGAYSDHTYFTTNTEPSKPTTLSPSQSQSVSTPPVLSMVMTDADDTAVSLGGNLSATCRVKTMPTTPNLFDVDVAGWTASNSGDTAGATMAWTWANDDFDGDGWGGAGYYKAVVSVNSAAANTNIFHSDMNSVWFPCVAGQQYEASAETRVTNTNIRGLVYIAWYNAAKSLLSTSYETDWVPIAVAAINNRNAIIATAPANAEFFKIGVRIRCGSASALGTVRIRNPKVTAPAVQKVRAMVYSPSLTKWTYQTIAGTNDVQTLTFGGTVTGGTYTISFNGATTSAINYNATDATIKTALEALSTVGVDDIVVSGGTHPTNPIVLTFSNNMAGMYQNAVTISSSLTGTAPTLTPVHTTSGVPGDVGPVGKYWWDGYGNDTVNTGDTASQAAFYYVSGPVVTVTSHTTGATITTSKPIVTWTATAQLKYRLRVYATGTTTIVYDSTLITSGIQSHEVPAGYLYNNTTYDFQVMVTNTSSIDGYSTLIVLTLTYSAPTTQAFTATAYAVDNDTDQTAVICTWEASDYSPSRFGEYILGRNETGGALGDETILRRLSQIAQVSFIDYFPANNKSYTYSLRQAVAPNEGSVDTIESTRAYADVTATYESVVINNAIDGGTQRVVLKFNTERSTEHTREQTPLNTWGTSKPIILQTDLDYQKISGTFTIIADTASTADTYMENLRELWSTGETICFRDERGRKIFGLLTKFSEKDQLFGQYIVDLEVTETDFREGQS